jgi:hypothetical protein
MNAGMATLLNELIKIERSENNRIKVKEMSLQNEINIAIKQVKIATETLCRLEEMQAKELAKPKSKRILIDSSFGWWLGGNGDIYKIHVKKSVYIENDNAFIDEESAQLQAQRNTLVYRMRVAALECPVDWSDQEDKYFLSFDCYDNEINIAYSKIVRRSQLPHFASKFKLEIFMNSLSTDEQKLLICGVE